MRLLNMKVDEMIHRCLIDCCGRCGDTERAMLVLKDMYSSGITPDSVVYNCLVNAFSMNQNQNSLTKINWKEVIQDIAKDELHERRSRAVKLSVERNTDTNIQKSFENRVSTFLSKSTKFWGSQTKTKVKV